MGRTVDLGKVMVSPAGKWRRDASYEFLTAVNHNGCSWLSRVDNAGVEPGTDDNVWMLLASAGTSVEVTKDTAGNIYVNGELLTSAFADAEAAARQIVETNTSMRAEEESRVIAERARAEAERLRADAESTRRQSETSRVSAEMNRDLSENTRASNEANRVQAEQNRVDGESYRSSSENSRQLRFNSVMEQVEQALGDLDEHGVNATWKKNSDNALRPVSDKYQDAVGKYSLAEGASSADGQQALERAEELSYSNCSFGSWTITIPNSGNPELATKISGKAITIEGYGPYTATLSSESSSSKTFTLAAVSSNPLASFPGNLPASGKIVVLGEGVGAVGYASHVEGVGTQAYNSGEHASGRFNKSTPDSTIFSVGIGLSKTNRKNAFEIHEDGKVYMYGVGGYDGTNPASATPVDQAIGAGGGGGTPSGNYASQADLDAVTEKIPSAASSSNQLADKAYVGTAVSTGIAGLASQSGVDAINAKIPSAASSSNQLADKEFVRESVASGAGDLITDNGSPWSSLTDLQNYAGALSANDYAFVVTTSGTDTVTSRYKYDGTAWVKEYDINSSTLSSAQLAAANSGITSQKVAGYDSHLADTDVHLTAAEHTALGELIDDHVFAAGTGTNAALQIAGSGQENAASGDRSLAIGERNTASGRASVAEGSDTQATATDAHAMGNKCLASGGASLATGVQNVASEIGSFAQGICTIATAQGASAMNGGFRLQIALSGAANGTSYTGTRYGTNGEDAINDLDLINQFGSASDYASFLVGCVLRQSTSSPLVRITACTVTVNRNQSDELTGISYQITTDKTLSDSALTDASYNICLDKASGPCSNVSNAGAATAQYAHAEGHQTLAFGVASHAEGRRTVTRNEGEHAEGEYNVSYKASDSYNDPGNSIHTIGVGTEEVARKNAVTVMRNGDIYVKGVGSYDGINLSGADTLQDVISNAQNGGPFSAGTGDNAVIHNSGTGFENTASGNRALSVGEKNVASGRASVAEGLITVAAGTASHAMGSRTKTTGQGSLAVGLGAIAGGTGGFAQGVGTITTQQGASAMNGGQRLLVNLVGAAGATTFTATNSGTSAIQDYDFIQMFGSASEFASFLVGCALKQTTDELPNPITACTVTPTFDQNTGVIQTVEYSFTFERAISDSALTGQDQYQIYISKAAGQFSNSSNAGIAVANYSHAEGGALSFGRESHAEGNYTYTKNLGEHSEGSFNVPYKDSDTFGSAGNSIHTIGIGYENYERKNAVAVMQNGDIYMKGVGSYDGVNLSGASTLQSVLSGLASTVSGIETLLAAI